MTCVGQRIQNCHVIVGVIAEPTVNEPRTDEPGPPGNNDPHDRESCLRYMSSPPWGTTGPHPSVQATYCQRREAEGVGGKNPGIAETRSRPRPLARDGRNRAGP